MEAFDYTVQTTKGFDQAVSDIEAKTREKGFAVLHVHDVQAIFAGKGIEHGPLKIIEVCNAKYASQVLSKDIKISLMLPCRISVYTQGGTTMICALRPKLIADFYPKAGIGAVAAEVDKTVLGIVDESK